MEQNKLNAAIARKNALKRRDLLNEAIAESDRAGTKGTLSHRWEAILRDNK